MAGLGLLENMRYFYSERETGIDEIVSFSYCIPKKADVSLNESRIDSNVKSPKLKPYPVESIYE